MKNYKNFKKSTIKIILLTVFGVFSIACVDDNKNIFNDFLDGAAVKFSEPLPAVFGVNDPEDLIFSATIETPDGNVVSYSMEVQGTLSGIDTGYFPIGTEITSFPTTITLTAQDFATALGVDLTNIGFGDTFSFRGTATNSQGTTYNYERIDYDDVTLTATGGGNTDDYLDEAGYRNAFIFAFSIACPEYDSSSVVGTYAITVDDFGTFLDDGVFEIIAGPGENQFTMIDVFGHPEMYDVIININPSNGNISVDRQPAWHCDNFGCPYGEGRVEGSGLAFTCVGSLTFTLENTVDAGSFGSYALKVEKI